MGVLVGCEEVDSGLGREPFIALMKEFFFLGARGYFIFMYCLITKNKYQ